MVKLPKRNKSKDNPYTLGFNEKKQTYTVEFVDSRKTIHNVEISEKIYQAFNEFELDDISQIHKYQRHIEHSEIYEESLNKRAVNKPMSVEEQVEVLILNEQLKNAISSLPEVQKRRIKKYFFDEMTLEQIARQEHCTKRAVKFSIDIALEKILQNLKK